MNRRKKLLSVFILIALTLSIVGCGLIGADQANSDISGSLNQDLPEWLTVAHRAQMEIRPIKEPQENSLDLGSDGTPLVNQPSSLQPSLTQPAPQPSGIPKWQQPGTMEYLTKLQLDQTVVYYKLLNDRIVNFDEDDPDGTKLKALKKDRADLYKRMNDIAIGIGLSLDKEYDIKPPPPDPGAAPSSTWFKTGSIHRPVLATKIKPVLKFT
jgi:hypothetical protein